MMFRTRLRQLREDNGYKSQQAFADAFGVAQSTVAGWESGNREPNYETTIRLADFLHTSIDYLLGRDKKEKPAPVAEDRPNTERKQFALEDSNRLLVAMGFIEEGQDLSDDDLAFLTHIIGLLDNRFSKRGPGATKNRPPETTGGR